MNFQLYQPQGGFIPASAGGVPMMGIPSSPLLGQQIVAGRGILAASPAAAAAGVRPVISQTSALAALQQPQMVGRGMGLMALPRAPVAARAPLTRAAAPGFLMAGTPPTVMSPTADGAGLTPRDDGVLSVDISHLQPSTSDGPSTSPNPAKKRKTSPTYALTLPDTAQAEIALEYARIEHLKRMELLRAQMELVRQERELIKLKKSEMSELFRLKKELIQSQIAERNKASEIDENVIVSEIEKFEKETVPVSNCSSEVKTVANNVADGEKEKNLSDDAPTTIPETLTNHTVEKQNEVSISAEIGNSCDKLVSNENQNHEDC